MTEREGQWRGRDKGDCNKSDCGTACSWCGLLIMAYNWVTSELVDI